MTTGTESVAVAESDPDVTAVGAPEVRIVLEI
jgi:hypothetical protein